MLSSLAIVEIIVGLLTLLVTIYIIYHTYVVTEVEVEKRRVELQNRVLELKRLKENDETLIPPQRFSPAVIQEFKNLKVQCKAAETRVENFSERLKEVEKEIGKIDGHNDLASASASTLALPSGSALAHGSPIVTDQTEVLEADFDKQFTFPDQTQDQGFNSLLKKCLSSGDPSLGVQYFKEMDAFDWVDVYEIDGEEMKRKYTCGRKTTGGYGTEANKNVDYGTNETGEASYQIIRGEHTEISLTFPTSSPILAGSTINGIIYVESPDRFCNNEELFVNSCSFIEMDVDVEAGENGKKGRDRDLKSFPFAAAILGRTLKLNHVVECAKIQGFVCRIFTPNVLAGPIKAMFVVAAKRRVT